MNKAPIVVPDDAYQAEETYEAAMFGSMPLDGLENSMIIDEHEDGSFVSNIEFKNMIRFPLDYTIKVREQEDEPDGQQFVRSKDQMPVRNNKRNSISNYHSYNKKEAIITEGGMSLVAPPVQELPSSSSK